MQNGQSLSELFLGPLANFGSKVGKILCTQLFSLAKILDWFVAAMNEIFWSAQILQFDKYNYYNRTEVSSSETRLGLYYSKFVEKIFFHTFSVKMVFHKTDNIINTYQF
jgi:hypothetical protein